MVHSVTSHEEYYKILKDNKVVVVDFTAVWCGPCKMISPVFEQLANSTPGVKFIKLDVDQVQSVAAQEGITSMPTFISYINGQRVDQFSGADRNRLQHLVSNAVEQNKKYQDAIKSKLESLKVTETEEQLMQKSVKELKEMFAARGWSTYKCFEKRDLVTRLLSEKIELTNKF
ncbi:hypothetical protein HDV04_004813 [Boothiomyces sp. JEL0838]|nr:hypothetical protein HDV04_004813 [Boothiomyces sp. JEL0838]